ncbi:MAG TPA: lysylphosphatidylglycerol synthase transmembrane domain-containing protein [Ignavibacteriaceae bacterium]|nr:lysylphosphatidylglycerol synthase transmembrane domain-containing protein [Ignavibacteriaceae bacterium]
MTRKIRQRILISIAFAGIIYLAFSIYADFNLVMESFKQFNWLLLPLLLFLSMLNYLSRFIKWNYYLDLINIKLNRMDSFSIFCAGLIMSITPGKFGELFKSYLVKQIINEPISKTAPIVFAERITDFLSLVIISLIGAYIFNYGREITIIIGIVLIVGVIIISNRFIASFIIKLFARNKYVGKHTSSIEIAYESSFRLLAFIPLVKMTVLSVISWGFECIGYYIILNSFNVEVSIVWASFAYAFATIVGAVSMLPGGLGVTEGSLSYLVISQGYLKEIAFASTFIVRVVTLWFAVFIGVVSVIIYQKKFGKIEFELNNSSGK